MARPLKTKDTVSMEIPVELVAYFQRYYKRSTGKAAVIAALEHSRKLDLNSVERAVMNRSECYIVDGLTQYQLCLFSGKRDWRSAVGELVSDYLAPFIKEMQDKKEELIKNYAENH